jgi:hypothetical protein
MQAREGTWEHEIDFDWSGLNLTEDFVIAARIVAKSSPSLVNPSLMKLLRARDGKDRIKPEPILMTRIEEVQLVRAIEFCEIIGWTITQEVVVTDSLGESVLGCAMDGIIYLSRRAFMQGTKQVAATVLEEWLHITERCEDGSRRMQNWLLEKICSLGEEIKGEPL